MWSDAARAAARASQQGGLGQGGPATGGSGGVGPAGDVSGGPNATQGRLAKAGANSRGQWNGGKGPGATTGGGRGGRGGGRGGRGAGGSAHQSGVNAVARNMPPVKPVAPTPPAYFPNVAPNSYAYGRAGLPGM